MIFLQRNIICFLPFVFAFSCCFCDEEKAFTEIEKPIYTFAVAGHTYGNAETFTSSIYPPFLKKLKEDDRNRNFSFLFLTGDVVPVSTDSNWNTVRDELNDLPMSWAIAPGNHDLGLDYLPVCTIFEQSCGLGGPYQIFELGKNLMLVLNTCNPGWTLDAYQIKCVESTLSSQLDSIDNIFVFTHQLWWLKNSPQEFKLDSIKPNSYAGFEGKRSFWDDAFPLFDSLENEIYFFAGDLGAHHSIESYYEDHYKNFHFYGSGMGGGLNDNYLVVSVYKNGTVEIERIDF